MLNDILLYLCVSADIFDEVNDRIKEHSGLQTNCVGGGRIEHDPDEKTIKVYGYSQASFGEITLFPTFQWEIAHLSNC